MPMLLQCCLGNGFDHIMTSLIKIIVIAMLPWQCCHGNGAKAKRNHISLKYKLLVITNFTSQAFKVISPDVGSSLMRRINNDALTKIQLKCFEQSNSHYINYSSFVTHYEGLKVTAIQMKYNSNWHLWKFDTQKWHFGAFQWNYLNI